MTFGICTPHQIVFEAHIGRREVHFYEGNLMELDNLEDLGRDGRIILQGVLKKLGAMALAALICFWLGTSGGGGAFVHTALNLWVA